MQKAETRKKARSDKRDDKVVDKPWCEMVEIKWRIKGKDGRRDREALREWQRVNARRVAVKSVT